MSQLLTEHIIRHIFAKLGIIVDKQVDTSKNQSLMDKTLLLPEKLTFQDDNGDTIQNRVWGCQLSLAQQEMKLLLGDCSQDKKITEYCLVVQLKGTPTYGLYLVNSEISEPLIAVAVEKDWMPCSTFLQAYFLAGMEQIKDMLFSWSKCENYKDQYALMLSFIKYHSVLYSGE